VPIAYRLPKSSRIAVVLARVGNNLRAIGIDTDTAQRLRPRYWQRVGADRCARMAHHSLAPFALPAPVRRVGDAKHEVDDASG
jgi:hypothetical protein